MTSDKAVDMVISGFVQQGGNTSGRNGQEVRPTQALASASSPRCMPGLICLDPGIAGVQARERRKYFGGRMGSELCLERPADLHSAAFWPSNKHLPFVHLFELEGHAMPSGSLSFRACQCRARIPIQTAPPPLPAA